MKFNEEKQLENICYSCRGTGEQISIHGELHSAEVCGLCYGDKVVDHLPEQDIKRPYLAQW